jgi:hypothetical protein
MLRLFCVWVNNIEISKWDQRRRRVAKLAHPEGEQLRAEKGGYMIQMI